MTYRAPINDILLSLNHGAGMQAALAAGHYADYDSEITAQVLEEAGKFAGDILAPLNRVGDTQGAKWADGVVTLPAGYAEAYRAFVEQGWGSINGPEAFGGQGLGQRHIDALHALGIALGVRTVVLVERHLEGAAGADLAARH